ncbi:TPA: DUF1090 domain-containing protein [Salmonella enterica]|nr:DUF1090 domain-containing protein [Salmonella enterica]
MTSMKPQYIRLTLLAGLLSSFMVSDVFAGGHEECEYKRQHLERQIDYARAHNNTHRVAGLQEALREINVNCTDNGLLEKKKNRVAEKQRKVTERLQELEQARETGERKKIAKKQKRLDEALAELNEARSELSGSVTP